MYYYFPNIPYACYSLAKQITWNSDHQMLLVYVILFKQTTVLFSASSDAQITQMSNV